MPGPLATAAAKRDAGVCGALAVEMEAYPLAEWALAYDVPFVHARIILDAVADPLPDLGASFDAMGRLQWGSLARKLLAQPSLLFDMWRMVKLGRALAPRLGLLAQAVVDAVCG